MTKIVITGYRGRMGQALLTGVFYHSDIKVVGRVDAENSGYFGDIVSTTGPDVVIDFSVHTATSELLKVCTDDRIAMVIGTTGHTPEELRHISEGAEHVPIVMASNFSTGVNTLFWLTRKAAELLGPGYDLEVVEMHHRLKKDAPSGTAKRLLEILSEARSQQTGHNQHARFGRNGNVGERDQLEIGVHSIRGGDVVGDHTVIFAGNGERVELIHKASSRETFANGALRAAQWVVGKPPGLYSMQNVLGLV